MGNLAPSWKCYRSETMKNLLKISPLLILVGLAFQPSTAKAQVTGIVTVTATVIPPPAVDFAPSPKGPGSSMAAGNTLSKGGITLHGLSNTMVKLNFIGKKEVKEFLLQQDCVGTITAKELCNVKSVEIIYLGS